MKKEWPSLVAGLFGFVAGLFAATIADSPAAHSAVTSHPTPTHTAAPQPQQWWILNPCKSKVPATYDSLDRKTIWICPNGDLYYVDLRK